MKTGVIGLFGAAGGLVVAGSAVADLSCGHCGKLHALDGVTIAYGQIDANGNCVDASEEAKAVVNATLAEVGSRDRVRVSVNGRRSGLDVQYDLSPAVAADADFVAALEMAAQIWEGIIDDPVVVVMAVGFTSNQGFIAAAGSSTVSLDFQDTIDAVRADASAQESTYVNALPDASSIVFDYGFDTFTGTGLDDFGGVRVNTSIVPAISTSDFTGPGEVDASITFNTDFDFDNDPSDGLTPGFVDTVYVMTHELGHALGFISGTDGVVIPSIWDFYRVGGPGTANDPADLAGFASALRQMEAGDNAALDPLDQFPGIESPSFQLSTGTAAGGDGRQASHWKDQSALGLPAVIGVMDPTFESGAGIDTLNPISEADLLAFSLMGWDINLPLETVQPCPDIAGNNGVVDVNDLLLVLQEFGRDDPGITADVNDDQVVDVNDLLVVLNFFGVVCP